MIDYKRLSRNKLRRDKRKSYTELKQEDERLKKLQENFIKRNGK